MNHVHLFHQSENNNQKERLITNYQRYFQEKKMLKFLLNLNLTSAQCALVLNVKFIHETLTCIQAIRIIFKRIGSKN